MNETKALLLNIFRLTLAISNNNQNEAVSTFSNILDGVIVHNIADQFGNISSISNVDDDGIKLVINEDKLAINEVVTQVTVPVVSGQTAYNFQTNVNDIQDDEEEEEEEDNVEVVEEEEDHNVEVVEEEEDHNVEVVEEEEDDNVEVVEEEEDDAEVMEVEQDQEEEEVDQDQEEEVELNLEPVRIRKVLYWKDLDNGDLYSYLPNDEVGDLVGSYIDGKLTLNQ